MVFFFGETVTIFIKKILYTAENNCDNYYTQSDELDHCKHSYIKSAMFARGKFVQL